MANRPDRRTVLKAGGALVGAIASPFIAKVSAAEDKVLYVNTWGGILTASEDAAFFQPFTKKTGVQIKPVMPDSYAKLKAQVQSGNYEWDVSWGNPPELIAAGAEGLLEHIDWSVVKPNPDMPDKAFRDTAISLAELTTNLAYRKDKFPNGGPRNWADFWNVQKFPGNRAVYDRGFTMCAFALLADGVPRDKLFPMDLDRAFKKLDELKPHIKVFYTQGNQQQQLIKDGEVDMLPMWNARGTELIQQGVPIEMLWEEAEHNTTYYYVAKGSPRAKIAWEFIDFCTSADRLADICERLTYGPANPKSFDFMKPEVKEQLPTWPANKALDYTPDAEWLAPRLASLKERWEQWKTG